MLRLNSRTFCFIFTFLFSLLIGGHTEADNASTASLDLLTGHDWQHFTGASVTPNGILIQPTGRAIVPQISVPAETNDPDRDLNANHLLTTNPPINIDGPILCVQGDFTLNATLEVNSTQGCSLYFYGTMPVIYDEWRQEGKTLRILFKDGTLTAAIWNGTSSDSVSQTFGHDLPTRITVSITKLGDQLIFVANGNQLGEMHDPGLFSNGQIVFGANAEPGGTFILKQLTAQSSDPADAVSVIDRDALVAYSVSAMSLRSQSARREYPIEIGAAVAAIPLMTDPQYRSLVAREFSMITPENDMKFQFIHPLPNVYTFNEADDIVNFALENHMKVHGHALVWHEALPRWVTDTSRSSAETKQLLSDHIRTIVGHYQGKVAEWDVVNEPLKDINLSTTYGLRSENPWYQAMGEFYIDFAFREAHAADPNAQLYLNEYGIEEPGEKFDILYALLKRLLARGVPINGIGFQMHEDMQNGQYVGSEPKLVESNMQRIAALGLKVRISEMDINLNADHVSKHLLYVQACGFSDMLKMALRQPNLASFAVWGVTDRYCSLTFDYSTFGNGLLFDVNYHPKTAYTQVQQVLSQNSRLSCKDQDGTIILP